MPWFNFFGVGGGWVMILLQKEGFIDFCLE